LTLAAAFALGLVVVVGVSHAQAGDVIGPCPGDCNGDRDVHVYEMLIAVDIALGLQPLDACSAADTNRDRRIAINELVALYLYATSPC
jgi:hypothetical protein